MSKRLVFIGLILVLVLSACALPGGKTAKAEEPVAEEPVAAEPVQPAEPAQPAQAEPTVEEVVAEPPTAEPAAPEPTVEEQAAGFSFRDDFDMENDNYSEELYTTTQAVTVDQMRTEPPLIQDGIMEWKISDNETFAYKFLNGSMTEDAVIEAKWKSNAHSLNGVALLCRVSEDKTGWYEFRISSQGEWQLLQYDKSIRDNDPFKNPYVTIKKGQAKQKLVRVSGDNVSKFTCAGSKLTYEVNGLKLVETTNTKIKGGGMIGIGTMSSTYVPVVIQWDYLSVEPPSE
jgi:hypothetical protein